MDRELLNPFAGHMVDSYLVTAAYGRKFRDEHDFAPSRMARVHHMRSVIQARLTADERYDLSAEFVEYGKVHFTDLETGIEYVLRSMGTVAVEQQYSSSQYALFQIPTARTKLSPQMLIYQFTKTGLGLSVSETRRRAHGQRLYVSGEITQVGVWPYSTIGGDDDNAPFNQDARDNFDDLGDFGFDEEAGGSGDQL